MKQLGEKLIRKVIPLFLIFGGGAGITASVLFYFGLPQRLIIIGLYFSIYVITGTLIGLLGENSITRIKGKSPVNRNEKGELLLLNQPLYTIAIIALIVAFITNYSHGATVAIFATIFYGLGFVIGLANGMFDYRQSISMNLLYIGILPISLTFLYAYYLNQSNAAIDFAWLCGSLFLFGYLLIVNRIKLDSIIFFKKSVNIEDSKKIRRFNDFLIVIFYAIYLVMFNFRKIINFSYDVLIKVFNWMLRVMEAISDWLLADIILEKTQDLTGPEKFDKLEKIERPWLEVLMKIVIYLVLGAVAIAAVISIVVVIIKAIKKLREILSEGFNRSVSEKKIKSKEYEEESEIVREELKGLNLKRRIRKYQYNLKNLKNIPLGSDKIRYVYGFVLERLYHKQIKINPSDTPEEIIEKIKNHKNGDELIKMGFDEFSKKYENARYSGREIDAGEDLEKKGEAFEKTVSDIKVEL